MKIRVERGCAGAVVIEPGKNYVCGTTECPPKLMPDAKCVIDDLSEFRNCKVKKSTFCYCIGNLCNSEKGIKGSFKVGVIIAIFMFIIQSEKCFGFVC